MITEGALEWEGVVGVNRAAGPKKNRVLELFARVKSPFSRLRRAKNVDFRAIHKGKMR